MGEVQTFIMRPGDDLAAHRLYTHLKRLRADGSISIQVTVAEYHGTRTVEQNQTMWGILKACAEQVHTNDGQLHAEQTWNRYMKEKHLPERCAKGIDKWRQLPSGERELVMSTSDLDTVEMDAYLQAIRNEATAELGAELRRPASA